jgi:hypothetical protein
MRMIHRQDSKGRWRWHWFEEKKRRWYPVPADRHDLPPTSWLRRRGAAIIRSEIKNERTLSLCGKFSYVQGYRFDYYPRSMMYDIPNFATSNEMRGQGEHAIVCWPINQVSNRI